MDNEINPLDDFLREAERSASFPFKENDWARMSAKLDEEIPERKRRWAFFSWPAVAAILLGIGLVGIASYRLLQSKRKAVSENEIAKSATPSQHSYEQEASGFQNERPSNWNTNALPTSKQRTSNQFNATLPEENHSQEKNRHTDAVATPGSVPNNDGTTPSMDREPISEAIQRKQGSNHLTKNKTTGTKTTSKEKEYLPVFAQNPKEPSQTQTSKPTMNASVQWVNGKPMQALDTQIIHQPSRMSEDEMIRYNPRYVRELKQYEATRLDSVTVIRFKPATPVVPFMNLPVANDSFLHSYRLQVLLGSMLWRGFIGGNTWSPAPYMSLGIDKALSKKLTLSAQVGFTYFAGLQTQNRTVSYRYKFGIDSTVYTALHNMVFRIQWPIQLKYNINKYHALAVGAGAAWQPDGISRVTAPVQVLNGGTAPSHNTPMQTKNQLGYLNGIRSWDGFLQFAYQYQWHERLALQVVWQAGLRDMTDNQILSSNRIQRNHGLMIGLRYGFVRNNR
ncbi:MAG: hypothetical protein FGM54_00660 [Chitinophagaceae bacterium]|nr:hypothetical protein [Chitinophagaceae bacterium]